MPSPTRPRIDAMLTIAPPPAGRIARTACLQPKKTPLRFTARMRSSCSSVVSASSCSIWTAALFTITWRRPWRSTAAATSPATSASRETSAWRYVPMPSIVASPAASFTSQPTTSAPSPANSRAIACPRPEPTPVTTAHRPSSDRRPCSVAMRFDLLGDAHLRSGRAAQAQLDGKGHLRLPVGLAVEMADQELRGRAPDLVAGHVDRRQRRLDELGEGEVVEAGHRQVVRDAQAAGAGLAHDADGEQVVAAHDRRGRLGQVEQPVDHRTGVRRIPDALEELEVGVALEAGRRQRLAVAAVALLDHRPRLAGGDEGDPGVAGRDQVV